MSKLLLETQDSDFIMHHYHLSFYPFVASAIKENNLELFSIHLTVTKIQHERNYDDNANQEMSVYCYNNAAGRTDAILRPNLLEIYPLLFQ